MALCPYCEAAVHRVTMQEIRVGQLFSPEWLGVAYSCPNCQKILSVAIDPVALKTDTVNAVVAQLRRG
jgi:hypothetical protein